MVGLPHAERGLATSYICVEGGAEKDGHEIAGHENVWVLYIYRVAHKKRPQLCSDVVRLNSRIQTKRNDSFKEKS